MNDILCKDVCLLLPLYIDNMLSDEEMTQVREHLAQCSSCRNEYDLLKGIMQQTNHLPQLEVSEDFAAKLHAGLEAAAAQMEEQKEAFVAIQPVGRKRLRFVPIAAACAAAVAISLLAFSRMPDTNQFITPSSAPSAPPAMQSTEPINGNAPESASPSEQASATQQPRQSQQPEGVQQTEVPLLTGGLQSLLPENKTENKAAPSAEAESHLGNDELAPNAAKASGVPYMRSALQEGKALSGTEREDMADSVDVSAASGASSGGSGGSSEAVKSAATPYAVTDSKTSRTVTFYFESYALQEAQRRMTGISQSDGKYVLDASLLDLYADILRKVDGYVSSVTDVQDDTAEYSRLMLEKESGSREAEQKLAEIDRKVSQCYIVLKEK